MTAVASKAGMLASLLPQVRCSRVPAFVAFSVFDFQRNRDAVLERIQTELQCAAVVVRSSAVDEGSSVSQRTS